MPRIATKHICHIGASGSAEWVLKFALANGMGNSPGGTFITRGASLVLVMITDTYALAHQLLRGTSHNVFNEVPRLLVGIAGLMRAPLFWIEWQRERRRRRLRAYRDATLRCANRRRPR